MFGPVSQNILAEIQNFSPNNARSPSKIQDDILGDNGEDGRGGGDLPPGCLFFINVYFSG